MRELWSQRSGIKLGIHEEQLCCFFLLLEGFHKEAYYDISIAQETLLKELIVLKVVGGQCKVTSLPNNDM